jgi:hypothetical protein
MDFDIKIFSNRSNWNPLKEPSSRMKKVQKHQLYSAAGTEGYVDRRRHDLTMDLAQIPQPLHIDR